MPEVTLTPTDFSQAVNLASNRTFVSLLDNRRDILYEKGYVEAFQKHLSGAVGEIAFAKWSWSYPTCSVNNFSGMGHDAMLRRSDATEVHVEIRHRTKSWYELNIRDKDDRSRIYVLTRGEPPVVDVVGWIVGTEVESHPEWRQAHGGWKECWFVPDEALHPMDELLR